MKNKNLYLLKTPFSGEEGGGIAVIADDFDELLSIVNEKCPNPDWKEAEKVRIARSEMEMDLGDYGAFDFCIVNTVSILCENKSEIVLDDTYLFYKEDRDEQQEQEEQYESVRD